MKMNKTVALVLALTLVIGVAVGGTLAWLTAQSDDVVNTFTASHMGVKLDETKPENRTAKMVPGWVIDKDPYATVDAESEDCYLFVEIIGENGVIFKNENGTYSLGDYIVYAVDESWTAVNETEHPNVYYKVIDGTEDHQKNQPHRILGDGKYPDPMDPSKDNDTITVEWGNDQVCVKPSVTETMMEAIANNQPELTFKAYAVQLYKSNDPNGGESNKFSPEQAWALVSG